MGMGLRVVALLLPLLVTACPKYGTADASAPAAEVAGTIPDAEPATQSLRLESLYLNTNVRFTNDAPPAHTVSLTLSGRTGSTLVGRLALDPNTCSLNVFGDREACTRIAVWGYDVELQLVRMIDPARMGRRYYEVSGEGLAKDLALIVRGDLEAGRLERCYLKLGMELVPLHVDARE
jgi:hypothetical protein